MTDQENETLAILATFPQSVEPLVSVARHARDGMYRDDLTHYQRCGRDALRNCALALVSANVGTPRKVLDFACGFGRVARYLRAAFPRADFSFCDAMPDASRFCASMFLGKDRPIAKDFSDFHDQDEYDLIWVGSLFTHLDEKKSAHLLSLLYSALTKHGVLVLTTHGRYVEERRQRGQWPYGIDAAQYDAMIATANTSGYGFAPYQGMLDYGISLTKLGWWDDKIAELSAAEIVLYRDRGWDRHQDVIALMKTA